MILHRLLFASQRGGDSLRSSGPRALFSSIHIENNHDRRLLGSTGTRLDPSDRQLFEQCMLTSAAFALRSSLLSLS